MTLRKGDIKMEGLTQRLIACVRDSCQKYDIKNMITLIIITL
jgi:hypothetical protein